jgi:hypothetical protein
MFKGSTKQSVKIMEQQRPCITLETSETLLIDSFSFNLLKLAWWIEIDTVAPVCTYSFGPFDHFREAQLFLSVYVEDLVEEGAKDIVALIKKCQPVIFTIY